MKAWNYMTPKDLADQLIYDRDFKNLELLLVELWAYRETTCEYCGGPVGDEDIMHKKCPE